jgi:hypothetical protein
MLKHDYRVYYRLKEESKWSQGYYAYLCAGIIIIVCTLFVLSYQYAQDNLF